MSKSKQEGLSKSDEMFLNEQSSSHSEQINNESQQKFQYDSNDEYKLSENYDTNRIVLQVKNPESVYAYWEYTCNKIQEVAKQAGYKEVEKVPLVLRVCDLTDNSKELEYYDIDITLNHNNWYLYNLNPGHTYEVKLGILTDEFHTILKSNRVMTPRNSISDKLDEEWMIVTEKREKIYDLAGLDELKNYNSVDIIHKMRKTIEKSNLKTGYSSLEALSKTDEVR